MRMHLKIALALLVSITFLSAIFAEDIQKPVVVLVHGYKSEDELGPLEEAYIKKGYEVVRFKYDWEASLEKSADLLVDEITTIQQKYHLKEVKVVAHSMGGLVSRRAMIEDRNKTLANKDFKVNFTSIASPFGGFSSANVARLLPYNILGAKESHRSLATKSAFITNPGNLGKNITHTKIETIETNKKRNIIREVVAKGKNSSTIYKLPVTVKDAVALPHHQTNDKVDKDPQITKIIRLEMGHVGVLVNEDQEVSSELQEVLSMKESEATSGVPCENQMNATQPLNTNSDLLKIAPFIK